MKVRYKIKSSHIKVGDWVTGRKVDWGDGANIVAYQVSLVDSAHARLYITYRGERFSQPYFIADVRKVPKNTLNIIYRT